ncbi:CARDB domain-containing protein [Chloroflexota bacterium]
MKEVAENILHSAKVTRPVIHFIGYTLLLALALVAINPLTAWQSPRARAAGESDLIIESITWSPENPSKSDTVTISATVKNQGDDKAIVSQLDFYVDGNFVEFQNVKSLEAGESSTRDFTWLAQQGSHQFRLVIDGENGIAESDESNNEKSAAITTLDPDLTIQEITWSPSDPYSGDNVTFTVAVKNQGEGKAINPLVVFHVNSQRLDADSPGTIDSGSTSNATFTWLTETGSHIIELIVDPNNTITESNESNNKKIADFPTISPDLIVQSITWTPEELSVGETVTFSISIENQGRAYAPASVFSYYIGSQTSGTERTPGIAAGNSAIVTFAWTAEAGPLPVRIVLDFENRATESNESNNETTATYSGTKVPDLIVQGIAWTPQEPSTGETMTLSVTIKNSGNGRADSSYMAYYIDDTRLGSDRVDPMEPGETQNRTFTWTVQEGSHTIRVIADSNRVIPESNEDNNEKAAVYPVPADLVIQTINLSPSEPMEGDNVTFTVTIENWGDSSAESFGIGYYVDNTYLGVADIGKLDSGVADNGTFAWIATTGRHTLMATVDYLDKVPEIDEDNNTIIRLFTVHGLSITTTPPVSPSPTPDNGESQPPITEPIGAPPGLISPDLGGGSSKNNLLTYYLLGLGGLILIAVIFFEVWRRQE